MVPKCRVSCTQLAIVDVTICVPTWRSRTMRAGNRKMSRTYAHRRANRKRRGLASAALPTRSVFEETQIPAFWSQSQNS